MWLGEYCVILMFGCCVHYSTTKKSKSIFSENRRNMIQQKMATFYFCGSVYTSIFYFMPLIFILRLLIFAA